MSLKLCLLLALCAPRASASFCATALAAYFDGAERVSLNEDTGAFKRKVLHGVFEAGRRTRYSSLVEETYPFLPGIVSKRLYRLVHTYHPEDRAVRPLTYREFESLVAPHGALVEQKERARRDWGEEIFTGLAEVPLRFGPDITMNWLEEEDSHRILTTLRLVQLPYESPEEGVVTAQGQIVEDLYGTASGFRDPYAKNFDPDAKWEAVAPPLVLPFQHLLKLNVIRNQSHGLDFEVGGYAAEEGESGDLRSAGVLEMWLQMSRAFQRHMWAGRKFMRSGVRLLSYNDARSQILYRMLHRIENRDADVTPARGSKMLPDGQIPFADNLWRIRGWSGASILAENQRIISGKHARFSDSDSSARRKKVFISTHREFDAGVWGDFDTILELLQSPDDAAFRAAACNLIYNLQYLEQEPGAEAKLLEIGKKIQATYDSLMTSSVRHRLLFLLDSFEFFATGAKFPILPPTAIPRWIGQALVGKHFNRTDPSQDFERVWLQELALNALYSISIRTRLEWPIVTDEPPSEALAKFEASLLTFLRTEMTWGDDGVLKTGERKRAQDSAQLALFEVDDLPLERVLSSLARVVRQFQTTRVSTAEEAVSGNLSSIATDH